MQKKFKISLTKLIGPVILGLILYFKIDFKKLLLIIDSVQWPYLFYVVIILLIKSPINPYRWQYILKRLSINCSFKKIFNTYYLTMLLGLITPGRVGEIIFRMFILKKEGYLLNKSLVSIILDRLADLFFLLLFSSIGVLVFLKLLGLKTLLIILIPLFGIILFLILIQKDFSKKLLEKFFLFLIPKKFCPNSKIYFKNFIENLQKFTLKDYLIILLLTSGTWIIIIGSMYVLARGWNITAIPFFYFALSIILARLVGLLPISIGGLGTREAILLGLFSFFSISSEKTIGFSLSMFVLAVLVNGMIGVYIWLRNQEPFYEKK